MTPLRATNPPSIERDWTEAEEWGDPQPRPGVLLSLFGPVADRTPGLQRHLEQDLEEAGVELAPRAYLARAYAAAAVTFMASSLAVLLWTSLAALGYLPVAPSAAVTVAVQLLAAPLVFVAILTYPAVRRGFVAEPAR